MSSKEGVWVKNHLILRLLHGIQLRRPMHHSYLLLLLILLLQIVSLEIVLIWNRLMVARWELERSSSHKQT